jgi:hypothetical protein
LLSIILAGSKKDYRGSEVQAFWVQRFMGSAFIREANK